MPTKLSRYCDGIMEAAWLAAVLLVPVFFNVLSARIFEPDKIALLRSLALIILAAWIVKLIDQRGSFWDRIQPDIPVWKYLLKFPLLAWVGALALIYVLSTIFSVTPAISLWGSYQRLQGTYTTLSYLVIFAALVGNLRRRAQLDRLVTTTIMASIPVALYGFLQRNQIDPIPWGGDVSRRIASNLGNSIFVAAYLIMVFPLAAMRIIQSFQGILMEKTTSGLAANVVRGTIYVFIAAIQIIAIYMSQSRGPALGWLVGMVFMALLLSYLWRKHWLTWTIAGAGAVIGIFILVLQVPGGPLEGLRRNPAIGRFGSLLDADSNSAKVRKYIWQGAADLVAPHEPLVFPDGSRDSLNLLRPLVGYGPESMYVAYNQFYVPELGQVERRNASPDRSHNETWDSLVTTGALGLIVYLGLFVSVFFFGLKWLGMIQGNKQRNLFLGLCLAGGVIGAVGLALWREVAYFGVGLPIGIVAGMVIYIILASVLYPREEEPKRGDLARGLLLTALLTAIVSHYVEINFGIAIVSTRTLFWTYSALIISAGLILPLHGVFADSPTGEAEADSGQAAKADLRPAKARKRRMDVPAHTASETAPWLRDAVIGAALVGLLLITFGYLYITNSEHYLSIYKIWWYSFTRLPNQNNAVSYGILGLILTTWILSSLLWVAEMLTGRAKFPVVRAFVVVSVVSFAAGFVFWLVRAGQYVALEAVRAGNIPELIGQVDQVGGLLTMYYLFVFLLILAAAFYLREKSTARRSRDSFTAVIAGAVLTVLIVVTIFVSNLRIIHADMAFKMAEPFNRDGGWMVATEIYKHAADLAPNEDHYYIFLARSYLEQAKEVEDTAEVEQLVRETETDLRVAQKINPLNTDHTANLARLYTWWAGKAENAAQKAERAQVADGYYETALRLSPQNSTLLGEWALLLGSTMGNREEAVSKLEKAVALDPNYIFTQGLLGDHWAGIARTVSSTFARDEAYAKALEHYRTGIDAAKPAEKNEKISYLVSLGNLYIEFGEIENAISAFEEALSAKPAEADLWRIEEMVARLYLQQNDRSNALLHARAALAAVPDGQAESVESLIAEIQALP